MFEGGGGICWSDTATDGLFADAGVIHAEIH
jgi:hypothetical protein